MSAKGYGQCTSDRVGAACGQSPPGRPVTWAGVLLVGKGSEWQWTDGCKTQQLEKKLLPAQGEWGLVHLPPLLVHPVANTFLLVARDTAFLGRS